ncbi:unnamed protein product, partial [Meganyctiphanes norvegica]
FYSFLPVVAQPRHSHVDKMLGYILLISLVGNVFATEIFFDSPTPTEPHQVSKFFTIQYITSTVVLSPYTVTETVNPTCTITASSIPVCGEASVGIIFTSGGSISPPIRLDVITTENPPIASATEQLPQMHHQKNEEEEETTSGTLDEDENNMMEEDSMTTTLPLQRFDLTENETNEDDYSEFETTTFMNFKEEAISNNIIDDVVSCSPNSNNNMNIKNEEEIISVTSIDSTADEEVLSIINAINSSPQTSVISVEGIQSAVQTNAQYFDQESFTPSLNLKGVSDSDLSLVPSSAAPQEGLPLSTSYEMATVVLPSCDCAGGRQPRTGEGDNIITFMTTKTLDVATATVTGRSMHTIQYAGCVPEDAVITTACV